ncbi:hypothetical protein PAMA_013063 [Pampus argenteus]
MVARTVVTRQGLVGEHVLNFPQRCQMDLDLLSVCVKMVCLLGAACFSTSDVCPCPEVPTHPLTKPPPQKCYQIGDSLRYDCIDGYVRKAGTSNLIKCKRNSPGAAEWTKRMLSCIPDPKRTTTQPPNTTVTTPSTSQQIDRSGGVSASVTTKPGSTEPTLSGPGQRSLSNHTQGRTLVHKSAGVTRAATWTTSNSTLSAITVVNNSSLIHEPIIEFKKTTAAVMAVVSVVIICAVIGIFLSYNKWKKRVNSMPPNEAEETIPMNYVPSGPAS